MSLIDQTAAELSQGLGKGEFSSRELVQKCLEQIDQHDSAIGAFLRVDRDGALGVG